MMNQNELTDAMERDFVARRVDRISQPIDVRRLFHAWGHARRALRGG